MECSSAGFGVATDEPGFESKLVFYYHCLYLSFSTPQFLHLLNGWGKD